MIHIRDRRPQPVWPPHTIVFTLFLLLLLLIVLFLLPPSAV